MALKSNKVYAVKKGRKTGIFNNWAECQMQVKGYQGAEFAGFKTVDEAMAFLNSSQKSDTRDLSTIQIKPDNSNSDIVAYVDGSYDDIKKEYSSGVVLFINGEKKTLLRKENNPEMVSMRNVAGEIMGSMMAMKYVIDNKKVDNKKLIIYHDYEGISKWCTGEWKTNKSGTKLYKEFYMGAKQFIDIQFMKVKAHTGDKYNEEADKLARQALYSDVENNMYKSLEIKQKKETYEIKIKNNGSKSRKKVKIQSHIKYMDKTINEEEIIKSVKELWKKRKSGRKITDIISIDIYININELIYEWHIKTDMEVEQGKLPFN
jgi:ribonuclease HI